MALSVHERQQFLAEPHVGILGVDEFPGLAPLLVPIWYHYTPGGELWIHTPPGSRKAKAIRKAGRFSLVAHQTDPVARYVSVEGPVTRIGSATRDHTREMASRYLPPDRVDGYVDLVENQLGDHVPIYMRPDHWISADLGS